MTSLVSIVIPVFNRADIIARTLESCLAQTYPRFEIVLVDDCSTDDLTSALSPFVGEARFRLVRHDRNRGVSAARNSGVEAAKGDLVAFLDSDDAWQPTKLERQIELIAARDHDRFLCGTLTEVRSDQTVTRIRPKWLKPPDVAVGDYLFVHKVQRRLPRVSCRDVPLIGGCFAQTSSFLLPRTLALETPFRTTLNQYEDMAFLIDLGEKAIDFLLVEEALTVQHNDDRPGRLGARDDIVRGRRFLDELGGSLSPDARLAFEATHLAHLYGRQHPVRVVRIALGAFLRGAIAPRSVLGILSRSLLGQSGQQALRDWLMTWRWRAKDRGAT